MFRRTAIILCLILVTLQGVAGTNLTDGFSFLERNPLFMEFMSAVRSEGNVEKAENLRLKVYAQTDEGPEATIKRIRTDTSLARLYVETKEDTERVEELLEEAEKKLGLLGDKQGLYTLILGSEIDGIWYLQNPRNLGKGISSSRKINKAFKEFPQEVSSRLLKANSLLYAPSF
ncbi:MAG TPA: hypothetical protein DCG32_08820, partial [Sphaerochaeta sp.]|nr:hypothetical protein [Sphaerochaeta sp.]